MPFKFSKPVSMSSLALAVLLSGCNQDQQSALSDQQPEVGVITLHPQNVELSSFLPGRTIAYRVAEVRPQVDGIILSRLFKEGADISAGQQLYQIDPATYEATLANAQASAQQYNSLAARYKQLVGEQAVSRQEYDNARAQQLQADAQLKAARINLRYTKVLAPISGRIGRSAVTEGALVSNGQTSPLAVIQQLDPIYVDVTQSYADMLKLRRALSEGYLEMSGANAAKVDLKLQDGSPYPLQGTLEFSEVSVDESTGSVTLRAVFPNPDHLLLPGMFVHAKLPDGTAKKAILAPQIGVTRNLKGMPTALVVNADNKVELRELKTSRVVGDHWLIDGGLNEGDKIIVEGLQYVKPGDTVNAHESNEKRTDVAQSAASPGVKSE